MWFNVQCVGAALHGTSVVESQFLEAVQQCFHVDAIEREQHLVDIVFW